MKGRIEEIITHECQTYAISQCVEYSDCCEVMCQLCEESVGDADSKMSTADFVKWREHLLSSFHSRINFAKILRNSENEDVVYPMIYRVLRREVVDLMECNTAPTIDDELKIGNLKKMGGRGGEKRSVAYKLSRQMHLDIYPQIINSSAFIPSSKVLLSRSRAICDSIFPLTYLDLVDRLEHKDNEFWVEMFDVVKNFVKFLFFNGGVKENRNEAIDELSLDCIDVLHKLSEKRELATKSSATHLLHSIQTTCRNKWREYLRGDSRNKSRVAAISDNDWSRMEDDSKLIDEKMDENRYDALEELDLSGIDLHNNYEVSCAVVHLLLHRDSRFYKLLVGKKESDVEIFMQHTLDKMSYEEIAVKMYGEATDRNKASIRQKSSRVTDWLKVRFVQLVEEYRREFKIDVVY